MDVCVYMSVCMYNSEYVNTSDFLIKTKWNFNFIIIFFTLVINHRKS